jgi:alkylated DNA repair dioxygenase AlkB
MLAPSFCASFRAELHGNGHVARFVRTGNRVTRHQKHPDLFGGDPSLPAGFRYGANFLGVGEEQALLNQIGALPFKEFQFHGFLGKRRVVSFGWRYDFNGGGLSKTDDMPAFLLPVRQKAAAFAGVPPSDLQQVLVTEYRPGAAIGWHKDRSVFGDVVGISLLAPCAFRFRRKKEAGWDRVNTKVEPRSIDLLRGPSRSEWEHSIPAVDALRYSLTFRNVLERGA